MKPRWPRRKRICGAWNPPIGGGRDTHICLLPRGHRMHFEPFHLCKCGAKWGEIHCGDDDCNDDHG